MKRWWPCLLFLAGNEIVSYLALIILTIMFFNIVLAEAQRRG